MQDCGVPETLYPFLFPDTMKNPKPRNAKALTPRSIASLQAGVRLRNLHEPESARI